MTDDFIDYHSLENSLVWIEWVDSISNQGWTPLDSEDHLKPLPRIQSVGRLIGNKEEFVVIAGDFSEHDFNRPMKIPKGCIKQLLPIRIIPVE